MLIYYNGKIKKTRLVNFYFIFQYTEVFFVYFLSVSVYFVSHSTYRLMMTSLRDFWRLFGQPIATSLIEEWPTLFPVNGVSISS